MNNLYACFPGCNITTYPRFIEFRVLNEERFKALRRVFVALKEDKHLLRTACAREELDDEQRVNRAWRDAHACLELFDKEARAYFWWPESEEEEILGGCAVWWQERLNDRRRKGCWTLFSMLEAFKDGEYELISCDMWTPDTAVLEFESSTIPYGGTDCIKVLVEAFGFQVIGEDDGTGYVQY